LQAVNFVKQPRHLSNLGSGEVQNQVSKPITRLRSISSLRRVRMCGHRTEAGTTFARTQFPSP
jgi:hypothetical protein